jgi:FkbM family methyltransferase
VFISYAQNFEDVLLHRALKHVEGGFYIDIGAQDATTDSVSRGFYELGWRGVHVEPVPAYAEKLRQERPGDTVLEVAISRTRGRLSFFNIPDTGISTGELELAQTHRAAGFDVRLIEVESQPLSDILDANSTRDIHWLKIDVEGMERQVIESWAPSAVRPWIVVIESTQPGTTQPAHQTWEPQLCALGYDFVYFDGLNRFYTSHQWPELKASFSVGPNCFDNFALATANRMACIPARELEQAQLSLETYRTQLAQAIEANAQLSADQAQSRSKLDATTTELASKTSNIARLELSLKNLRSEANQTTAKLQSSLMAARVDLINKQTELNQHLTASTATIAAVAALQTNLENQQSQTNEYRRQSEHFQNAAALNERQINALRQSTSWRITKPLRVVKRGTSNLTSLSRSLARIVLERALIQHRKHPQLAETIRSSLALIPPLERRFRAFSSARLPASHLTAQERSQQFSAQWWAKAHFAGPGAGVEQSPLLQRAEHIFNDLKNARQS